jgi:hypothetical protein
MARSGAWLLTSYGKLRRPDFNRLGRIVKRKLKKIQYWPHLINGCLASTGLTTEAW